MRLIPVATAMLVVWADLALADHHESAFYERSVRADQDAAYDALFHSLEESSFYIIAEPDIGKSLARNAKRWGENYNRNGLDAIRSLVFCSPWYANEFSNVNPTLLALCPFSATMLYREGVATVVFERPSTVVRDGPAKALVVRLEATVLEALDRAVEQLEADRSTDDSAEE